jgi:hypothetical protein
MQTHTELGTLEDFLPDAPPAVQAIFHQLRELIAAVHPTATEVIRAGDRAASYGWGPKKMSEAYVYLMPHAAYVNLGFYHGVALPDPAGLLAGTGKKMRHVKVRSQEAAARPELRALVLAAKAERQRALGVAE